MDEVKRKRKIEIINDNVEIVNKKFKEVTSEIMDLDTDWLKINFNIFFVNKK